MTVFLKISLQIDSKPFPSQDNVIVIYRGNSQFHNFNRDVIFTEDSALTIANTSFQNFVGDQLPLFNCMASSFDGYVPMNFLFAGFHEGQNRS